MAWTFTMVCVAWVFFRAESVGEAVDYICRTTTVDLDLFFEDSKFRATTSMSILILATSDFFKMQQLNLTIGRKKLSKIVKGLFYLILSLIILKYFGGSPSNFLYFQF